MRQVNKVICLIKAKLKCGKVVLLNYISADWNIPLFININLPNNPNDDVNEITTKLAARLSLQSTSIEVKFDRSDEEMKTSCVKETKDNEKHELYSSPIQVVEFLDTIPIS